LPDGSVGELWTGGTNIAPLPMPTYLLQRRPLKYGSFKALLDKIAKGSKDKLGLNEEKSDCTFQLWLKQQYQAHIEFGMDTVFLVPNLTWTSETNIFMDHTITLDKVQPWIDQLKNGVYQTTIDRRIRHAPCPYDKQNLAFSATYLKASLTDKFCQEVLHSVGLDATSIEVFICILRRKLHVVISLQRELILKLEQLDISQVAGENIPTFNIQIQELCESIEQADPPPADLNQLVMKCFLSSQVTLFANTVGQKYLELELDPQRHQGETFYGIMKTFI
jgi:hypothetical protein